MNHRRRHRPRLDRRLVGFTVCLALLTALAFSHQHSQQSPPLPVTTAHFAPPVIAPPPPKPAAPKPRLVLVSGNRLQDLPPAPNRWSAAFDARVPERGFNAYYFTHGSPARLHRAYHPYNMDREDGSSVGWAAIGQDNPSLADYADRWYDPGRLVAAENRGSIRIDYADNEFHNIPAEDFAACWLSYIDIAQGGYYQFKPQGGGLARIILDRHLVSDGHAGQAPPQLWLEPGRYLLEVEYLNYHHTAEYALGLELASTRRTP